VGRAELTEPGGNCHEVRCRCQVRLGLSHSRMVMKSRGCRSALIAVAIRRRFLGQEGSAWVTRMGGWQITGDGFR
jgi:hypothetical protein